MDYVCRSFSFNQERRLSRQGADGVRLLLHMAKHYGVTVRAFNISKEQILFARERAKRGVSHQVEFIEDDYRNISGPLRCLSPWECWNMSGRSTTNVWDTSFIDHRRFGRGLLHFIGRNQCPCSAPGSKRIFPALTLRPLAKLWTSLSPGTFRYGMLKTSGTTTTRLSNTG